MWILLQCVFVGLFGDEASVISVLQKVIRISCQIITELHKLVRPVLVFKFSHSGLCIRDRQCFAVLHKHRYASICSVDVVSQKSIHIEIVPGLDVLECPGILEYLIQ